MNTADTRGDSFRFGGEEFVVLLPNHTAREAADLAERIRVNISKEPLSSKKIPISASLGVAELEGSDAKDLIRRANEAQKDAKRLGRDLVRIFGERVPTPEDATTKPPLRKQPRNGVFSDEEKDSIRRNYFQSGIARCPFDSAKLEVDVYRVDEKRTADLQVTCPMCGVHDFLKKPE